MDKFPGDKPGPKKSSGAAAAEASSADGRLTDERRGEIMTRLNKHRSSASSASAGADAPKDPVVMTAAERRERVQQLLLERQQRLAGGSTSRRSPNATDVAGSRAVGVPGVVPRRGAAGSRRRRRARRRCRRAPRRAPRVRASRAPEAPARRGGAVQPERHEGGQALQGAAIRGVARCGGGEGTHVQAQDQRAAAPGSSGAADAVTSEQRISRLSTPRTNRAAEVRADQERARGRGDQGVHVRAEGGTRAAHGVGAVPSAAGRPLLVSDVAFPDRLYADGETRYRRREDARRQITRRRRSHALPVPAGHQRQLARRRRGRRATAPSASASASCCGKKQEALAAHVQVELTNPDLTFAPKVNDASRAIARGLEEEAGDGRSAVERLAAGERPGSAASRRAGASSRGRPSSARRKRADARSTSSFAPQLNENTKRLCDMMAEEGVRGGAGSFLERQADHAAKADLAKRAVRERLEKECTFHPNTGNADEVLLKSKHVVRLGETARERIARLAFLEKQTREQRRLKAEEAFHKQFSFRPKLSGAARIQGEPTPLHERSRRPARPRSSRGVRRRRRRRRSRRSTRSSRTLARSTRTPRASVPGELLRVRRHHQPHPRVPPGEGGCAAGGAEREGVPRARRARSSPARGVRAIETETGLRARRVRRGGGARAGQAPRAPQAREADGGGGGGAPLEGVSGGRRRAGHQAQANRPALAQDQRAGLGGRQGGAEAQKAHRGEGSQ